MNPDRMKVATRVGMAGWGDNRFRGRSVREQLLGKTSLAQLLGLAIGIELDRTEADLLDALAVAVTLADPHIWPVKLTRVVGSLAGSPIPGFVAGMLATDGVGLGPGSVRPAAAWLSEIVAAGPDHDPAQLARCLLAEGRRLPGFGVPARRVDERVEMVTTCIRARARDHLPHWAAWTRVVDETRRDRLEPNIASAFAAAVLDLGVPASDVVVVAHLSAIACFLSNAVEGAKEPCELLRSVPHEFLEYHGPAMRASPRR